MVSDTEPRYRLVDSNGNVVGSLYAEADGTLKLQEGTSGSDNEVSVETDGTFNAPAVSTEAITDNPAHTIDREGGGNLGVLSADTIKIFAINPAGSGGTSLSLPASVDQGTVVVVVDEDGAASSDPITISVDGSGYINQPSSETIDTDYGFRQFVKMPSGSPLTYAIIANN